MHRKNRIAIEAIKWRWRAKKEIAASRVEQSRAQRNIALGITLMPHIAHWVSHPIHIAFKSVLNKLLLYAHNYRQRQRQQRAFGRWWKCVTSIWISNDAKTLMIFTLALNHMRLCSWDALADCRRRRWPSSMKCKRKMVIPFSIFSVSHTLDDSILRNLIVLDWMRLKIILFFQTTKSDLFRFVDCRRSRKTFTLNRIWILILSRNFWSFGIWLRGRTHTHTHTHASARKHLNVMLK